MVKIAKKNKEDAPASPSESAAPTRKPRKAEGLRTYIKRKGPIDKKGVGAVEGALTLLLADLASTTRIVLSNGKPHSMISPDLLGMAVQQRCVATKADESVAQALISRANKAVETYRASLPAASEDEPKEKKEKKGKKEKA